MRGLQLSEPVFRLLADLVRRRTGYVVADGLKVRIESRLVADARNAGGFYQLFTILRNEPRESSVFGRLVDAVVNGETYFFRDPCGLAAFADEIAPERLLAGGQDGVLDVWSAGCSTGEEAYTLSMLLSERSYASRRFQIRGTDLSPAHIRRARAGVYGPHALRATSTERLQSHFEPADGGLLSVRAPVREAVTFENAPILDEPLSGPRYDVILCRNVLIYLSEEARARAIEVFTERLKPGGYILLGPSDALATAASSLTLVRLRHDIAYRK